MLARLLLAAALLVPQLSPVAHAFEVARAEADHPVCVHAADKAGYESRRFHDHHGEGGCRQCPRPVQGCARSGAALDARPPFCAPPSEAERRAAASAVPPSASRGPPSR